MATLATLLSCQPASAGSALHFDGTDDHLTMGLAPTLGLSAFTLECWMRWDGVGLSSGSGTGGVTAVPLISKGRGQSDGDTEDCNYIFGIRALDGVLVADFEDMDGGANHPVAGKTGVRDGQWHHVAASYDGSVWALYVDGVLDGMRGSGGAIPRHDSAQHFGVATAMNTWGVTEGAFRGAIDEVRVWSAARTAEQIAGSMNAAIDEPVADLVARWGMDEETGTAVVDSVSGLQGQVHGAAWVAGAPFASSLPPLPPELVAPPAGDDPVPVPAALRFLVDDPEGDAVQVRVFGRVAGSSEDTFTVVALPDTQYYSCECSGGDLEYFVDQTTWIVEHREELGIAFVQHLGDITDHGDGQPEEWDNADVALSILEDPATTGLTDGIPYGLVLGNHDQVPDGADGATVGFNEHFGVARYEGRSWYGGHYGDDNDNSYELFSAGGMDFVAISLEYDPPADPDIIAWADGVLQQHSDRRAIVSTHHLLGSSGAFGSQGGNIYASLRERPGLFLMMGGHIASESWRADINDERTVYSMLADYQYRSNGGDGWLRILTFDVRADEVRVETFSPSRNEYEVDLDSSFAFPYRMHEAGFDLLDGPFDAVAGEEVEVSWDGLQEGVAYEWFVEVSDGRTTVGDVWSFVAGVPGDDDSSDDDDPAGDDDSLGDDEQADGEPPGDDDDGCDCGAGPAPQESGTALACFGCALLLVRLRRREVRGRVGG